jgi:hypothetical protein
VDDVAQIKIVVGNAKNKELVKKQVETCHKLIWQ